jgi:N-acyl-D-aspartate/D-glutamate deacylase
MLIRLQYASLAQRLRQVEKCLAEGALGVCHSIEYQPTPYSELVAYGRLAYKYKRPFFLHLRYSAQDTELKGVQEAIQLAKDTEAHIHIAHLHSTGGTYHMAKALALMEEARKQGLRLTACVYPYSYWATYLASKRFDEGWQQRFNISYEDLTVVGTGERLNAKTFQQYRQRQGLLVAVPEGTMPLDKTVDLALQTDFCMVASDGGIESEPRANNHPRGAACFATFIRHGLRIGLSMPQILAKITTLPRQLMLPVLEERGEIASGRIADLTIFDPTRIQGKASVANPNQFSEGIEAVVLNGTLVYQQKKLLAQKGQAIRYSS